MSSAKKATECVHCPIYEEMGEIIGYLLGIVLYTEGNIW
jgi:hypothetical protein